MEPELFTGVLGDPREDEKVINGWSIDEVLAESAALNWREKGEKDLVKYPVWDQHRTSACVAFAKAKQVSIEIFRVTGVWIDFSPASIYQLRANKPGEGMWISNANDIVNKSGVTLEALMKSQNLTEEEINKVHRSHVADLFAKAIAEAVVAYLYVPVNIDRIAQVIERGRAVSLLIFGERDEYARKDPVVIHEGLQYANASIRHEVDAVDYFLDDGVKKLRINDSAHFGGFSERNFDENWLAKRCILADALDIFTFDPMGEEKPTFNFQVNLKIGDRSDEVVKLQNMLKYEKAFPANQDSTGLYGPITAKAVLKWQIENVTSVPRDELERLKGEHFGPASREVANRKFSN